MVKFNEFTLFLNIQYLILPSFMFIFKNKGGKGFSILLRNFCCVFADSSMIDQVNDNNKSRKRGGGAKAQLYSEG